MAMESALEKRTRMITEGSVVRALFMIAGPIVLANTLHTAHQLVNTFWVGRLGAGAVAAVSVSFPLIFLLIALGGGLAVAGSVFVAHYAGARKFDRVNHVAAQTMIMVVSVSLALSSLGYLSTDAALSLLGIEESVRADASLYMRTSFAGLVFGFAFMMFQSIMQGAGEVRLPLYIVSATVAMNAVLDPLLIFGFGPIPPLGVAGAAFSTLGTQAVSAVVGMAILFSGRFGIRLTLSNFRPDFAFIKRAVSLGVPASIEQSTRSLGAVFLTFVAAGFGTLALATYGMGMRVMSFVFIPALGLSMATATMIGQNIGAGHIERAAQIAKTSSWFAFLSLTGIALPFFVFSEPLVRFFVPGDEALVAAGGEFVRIVIPSFGLIAAQQVLLGAFRGAGQTFASMAISLVSQWLIQLPLAWGLATLTPLGATGIWWAFPLSSALSMAITLYWYRLGSWRRTRLTAEERLTEEVTEKIIIEEGPQ